jgi:hypothetical protein
VSEEQLDDFVRDLRRLIKYEERHGRGYADNRPTSSKRMENELTVERRERSKLADSSTSSRYIHTSTYVLVHTKKRSHVQQLLGRKQNFQMKWTARSCLSGPEDSKLWKRRPDLSRRERFTLAMVSKFVSEESRSLCCQNHLRLFQRLLLRQARRR